MRAPEKRDSAQLLSVRVQPRASREGARLDAQGRLCVALTAPPVEGAANTALCSYIARQLGLSKSSVTVLSGQKSRDKTLRVENTRQDEIKRFLESLRPPE